jgi:hypothetical protein
VRVGQPAHHAGLLGLEGGGEGTHGVDEREEQRARNGVGGVTTADERANPTLRTRRRGKGI